MLSQLFVLLSLISLAPLASAQVGGAAMASFHHRKPQVAFVQKQEAYSSASASYQTSGTFSTNPTTGNTMICWLEFFSTSASSTTMTDTQSNTYTKAATITDASQGAKLEIWYAPNITGGSAFQVTANLSTSIAVYKGLSCSEYSGLQASPLDQTASLSGTNSTGVVNIQPTYPTDLLFVVGMSVSGALAPGAGLTTVSTTLGPGDIAMSQLLTTTSPVDGTMTNTGNQWSMLAVTFKSK